MTEAQATTAMLNNLDAALRSIIRGLLERGYPPDEVTGTLVSHCTERVAELVAELAQV